MSEQGTVLAATPASSEGAPPSDGQPSPSEAPSTPYVGADGGFSPGWYSGDERIADAGATLDRFANPAELGNAYMELRKMHPGAPPADATDEVREAFRERMGIPEKYEIKAADGESPFDEKLVVRFAEVAQRHNGVLSNAAMQDLANEFNAVTKEAATAAQAVEQQAQADAFSAMEAKHGADWNVFLEGAQRAATKLGIDPNDPAFGNNPAVIDVLGRISAGMSEGTLDGLGNGAARADWAGAGAEAKDIMTNKANPLYEAFHDSSHPRHREAHQKYDRAMETSMRAIGG